MFVAFLDVVKNLPKHWYKSCTTETSRPNLEPIFYAYESACRALSDEHRFSTRLAIFAFPSANRDSVFFAWADPDTKSVHRKIPFFRATKKSIFWSPKICSSIYTAKNAKMDKFPKKSLCNKCFWGHVYVTHVCWPKIWFSLTYSVISAKTMCTVRT